MKISPNDPAMPIKGVGFNVESEEIATHEQHADFKVNFPGMSIRTELAARAMQGMLVRDGWAEKILNEDTRGKYKEDTLKGKIVAASVAMADALIAELNKPTE